MKWSVVLLLVIGIVAAGAVAVLLATFRAHTGSSASAEVTDVQIIVAARPLEPYSVVQSDALKVRRVPVADAPKGCPSDPAAVIGKALRMRVAEGQVFTDACFATDDSPQSVASRLLPPGKRAKTIALSDDAAMQGLLYPGCMVDVLWCFNGHAAKGNPLSKMVLENIPVLAVGKQTALSAQDSATEAVLPRANARQNNLVTLLLEARQAEALQLALDQGSIALVLRNPTDTAAQAPRPLSLSTLAEEYFPFASADRMEGLLAAAREFGKALNEKLGQGRPAVTVAAPYAGQEWETTIIRGQKLEKAKFIVSSVD